MKPTRNPAAKALATPVFRKRVVRDKTKYSRKGRTPKGSALDRIWIEGKPASHAFQARFSFLTC